jgi:hypothetical protein
MAKASAAHNKEPSNRYQSKDKSAINAIASAATALQQSVVNSNQSSDKNYIREMSEVSPSSDGPPPSFSSISNTTGDNVRLQQQHKRKKPPSSSLHGAKKARFQQGGRISSGSDSGDQGVSIISSFSDEWVKQQRRTQREEGKQAVFSDESEESFDVTRTADGNTKNNKKTNSSSSDDDVEVSNLPEKKQKQDKSRQNASQASSTLESTPSDASSKFNLHVKLATLEGQLAENPHLTMDEAKAAAKKEYNRRIAARARQRGKFLMEELQETVQELTKRINKLTKENDALKDERDGLKNEEEVVERQPPPNMPATKPEVSSFPAKAPMTHHLNYVPLQGSDVGLQSFQRQQNSQQQQLRDSVSLLQSIAATQSSTCTPSSANPGVASLNSNTASTPGSACTGVNGFLNACQQQQQYQLQQQQQQQQPQADAQSLLLRLMSMSGNDHSTTHSHLGSNQQQHQLQNIDIAKLLAMLQGGATASP